MKVVLLGAGGTGTSFAIASRLRANWNTSVKIIITDIYPEHLVTSSVLADTFFQVPNASDPAFRNTLTDIMLREKVTTYIPILNEEIILAAELMKEPMFSHIDFWSSRLHALCIDKIYANEWLQNIGIRTPKTLDVNNASNESGMCFVKPRDGFGSKGAQAMKISELHALPKEELNHLLIQEICESPEVTVDSFYDADTGQCYSYCRERIETKSGVCTKARIFADTELNDFASKIGKALGQRGSICFQAMKNKEGWVVTDLNLRSGAGTAMTCAAGFDVLSAAFACRIGEDYTRFLKAIKASEVFYVTRQYSEFVMRHQL